MFGPLERAGARASRAPATCAPGPRARTRWRTGFAEVHKSQPTCRLIPELPLFEGIKLHGCRFLSPKQGAQKKEDEGTWYEPTGRGLGII